MDVYTFYTRITTFGSNNIQPFNWHRSFFSNRGARRFREGGGFFDDIFRGFDQMSQEMEREFEDTVKSIE
jgi:hypothetical protein